MGHSLSWIATRGISSEEVQRLLGIRAIPKGAPLPPSSCTAAQLENGWHLVFFASGCDVVDRCAKALLTQAPEAVTCFVEEHVMASAAAAWKDGRTIWAVEHESEQGIYHLKIQGTPPDSLARIASSSKALQEADGGESANVDHNFDVPVDLAESLVGFHHDKTYDYGGNDPWFVCEMPQPSPKAIIRRSGCLPLLLLGGVTLAGIIARHSTTH